MTLLYGQLVEVFTEEGMEMGRVRVGGVLMKVPLKLVADAQRGDIILLCDGVAIGKASDPKDFDKYVSSNTGKTDRSAT